MKRIDPQEVPFPLTTKNCIGTAVLGPHTSADIYSENGTTIKVLNDWWLTGYYEMTPEDLESFKREHF